MPPSNLARLRRICLSLPEATEVEAWGSPTFRVGKIFAMYAEADNHHGDGREGVWVKSKHFTQDLLVRGMPHRYFVPAYVGPGGWTGVYLDARTDWEALTELLRDAYRLSASKKLARLLSDDAPPPAVVRKSKSAATKPVAKAKTSKRAGASKSSKRVRAK
jgi:predicted DNA-binding protein (MmcQ/YjbR family)